MPPPKDPEKYEIWREKIRQAHIGKKLSSEHVQKIQESRKWYKPSEETKKKIGDANRGKSNPWLGGTCPWLVGRKLSDEQKQNISKALKGKPCKNYEAFRSAEAQEKARLNRMGDNHYTRKKPLSQEMLQRLRSFSESQKGKPLSEEHKRKISEANKGRVGYWKGKKRTPEDIKNFLCRRVPSNLENKFNDILIKYDLPYKYVGDGNFFIENLNPDFINVNGKKIAIEVYARLFKEMGDRTVESWKLHRDSVFAKYGWKIIYFDETQVTDECVLNKLSNID